MQAPVEIPFATSRLEEDARYLQQAFETSGKAEFFEQALRAQRLATGRRRMLDVLSREIESDAARRGAPGYSRVPFPRYQAA